MYCSLLGIQYLISEFGRRGVFGSEAAEEGVEFVEGEAHYVVEAAVNAGNTYGPDPFLNSIGSGFVKGMAEGDVLFNFLNAEGGEAHGGEGDVAFAFLGGGDCYACSHSVAAA